MDDQNREYEDYEALHDELFALLDQHRMKALSQKLGEMNEFDISEFLGELWEDNPQRMAMVFRILSKVRQPRGRGAGDDHQLHHRYGACRHHRRAVC